ncbi:hypothetical protein [Acaryochloris sp. CCMEE 5410]|uniref:hypothetical protein n=1 Tax=Acaryochloris sp. CCMEE 5410 TaxID=310037 RepID=UPI0002484931|nr:hypothetical protein [Acaryochloris sp. CCMEE 5410]KAI9129007.1 hypothetical protein ON05_037210 [Acaryochloris sp. CCMEE 5410]
MAKLPTIEKPSRGEEGILKYAAIPINANWSALEKLGFTRGPYIDSFLVKAALPMGWGLRWGAFDGNSVEIFDARDLIRVSVYYSDDSCDSDSFSFIKERFTHRSYFCADGRRIISITDAARDFDVVFEQIVGHYAISKDNRKVGFLQGNTFAYYGPKWIGLFEGIHIVQVNPTDYEVISKKHFLEWSNNTLGVGPQDQFLAFTKAAARVVVTQWIKQNVKGDPWSEENDFPSIANEQQASI